MSEALTPAVIQDADTLQVLMMGYMNEEALRLTRETGRVTFFSRSKGRLWVKGETSGNFLEVVSVAQDCDEDTLLIHARPKGPTCHVGTTSCWNDGDAPGIGFLGRLSRRIEQRYEDRPEGSYTTKLFAAGIDRMAQKVGEEGVEVAIASKNDDLAAFRGEAADLLYHLVVLCRARGVSLSDLADTLRERAR